jgi:hypothetical protein
MELPSGPRMDWDDDIAEAERAEKAAADAERALADVLSPFPAAVRPRLIARAILRLKEMDQQTATLGGGGADDTQAPARFDWERPRAPASPPSVLSQIPPLGPQPDRMPNTFPNIFGSLLDDPTDADIMRAAHAGTIKDRIYAFLTQNPGSSARQVALAIYGPDTQDATNRARSLLNQMRTQGRVATIGGRWGAVPPASQEKMAYAVVAARAERSKPVYDASGEQIGVDIVQEGDDM